jgi:hypothetical protein
MEKVAYLKGLVSGLNFDESTKEGKAILAILDVLEEMALSINDLEEAHDEIEELVDILDEDLGELEEDFYEFDEDDEDDDEDEEDFDSEDLCCDYEVVCPTCGDTICLNEEMVEEGEIECPNCHESLEFDFDDCDCKDCCDHEHGHEEHK